MPSEVYFLVRFLFQGKDSLVSDRIKNQNSQVGLATLQLTKQTPFLALKTWKSGAKEASWTIGSHIRVTADATSYNSFHKRIEFIIIWSNFYNDAFSTIVSAMWTEKNDNISLMQILFHMKFAVIVPQDFWEEMSVFFSETMFEALQSPQVYIFVNVTS